jgi:hypothetical protein
MMVGEKHTVDGSPRRQMEPNRGSLTARPRARTFDRLSGWMPNVAHDTPTGVSAPRTAAIAVAKRRPANCRA